MYDLINKLNALYGVSGNEEDIREGIKAEVEKKVDKIHVDTMGNLICQKKGKGKKILVIAHMDEPGIINMYFDDKGFIRFGSIGDYSAHNLLNQRVRYKNGVTGVILSDLKDDEIKNLKHSNLYIDIGAKNKEDIEKVLNIGDTASFVSECIKQGDYIISKSLDSKVACAIIIDTINKLPKCDNNIYFVFTSQELLGQRGAKVLARDIEFDMAINIGLTMSGDDLNKKNVEVKCGRGPAIKIKDQSILCHAEVKQHLESIAKKHKIPFQYEINNDIKSDAGALHLSFGGIKTGGISIACRNLYSSNEMVDINDIMAAEDLLIKTITN